MVARGPGPHRGLGKPELEDPARVEGPAPGVRIQMIKKMISNIILFIIEDPVHWEFAFSDYNMDNIQLLWRQTPMVSLLLLLLFLRSFDFLFEYFEISFIFLIRVKEKNGSL